MRERDIEAHLVKRVKELGGEVRKVQWVGRIGAPDRLVMLPCRSEKLVKAFKHFALPTDTIKPSQTIWVELKAPGAKPRPSQLREHDRMRALGQRVVVIDSLEGVEELLA